MGWVGAPAEKELSRTGVAVVGMRMGAKVSFMEPGVVWGWRSCCLVWSVDSSHLSAAVRAAAPHLSSMAFIMVIMVCIAT